MSDISFQIEDRTKRAKGTFGAGEFVVWKVQKTPFPGRFFIGKGTETQASNIKAAAEEKQAAFEKRAEEAEAASRKRIEAAKTKRATPAGPEPTPATPR